jgi:hypothetical protein
VLPTTLPLRVFYQELVKTQAVISASTWGSPGWPRRSASLAG